MVRNTLKMNSLPISFSNKKYFLQQKTFSNKLIVRQENLKETHYETIIYGSCWLSTRGSA